VCVSYANISRMHLRERKRGEDIHVNSVWLFATERKTPIARVQEWSGKQGTEVERDVWRKMEAWRGREGVFVIERFPQDHEGTIWVGDRGTRVCVR
jgi:hypothetical protein